MEELQEVLADIREAKADLKRAQECGDRELELEIRRSINLLLEKEKRLTAERGRTGTGAVQASPPVTGPSISQQIPRLKAAT